MKNILILLLFLSVTSCTLSDKEELKWQQRPTLSVEFRDKTTQEYLAVNNLTVVAFNKHIYEIQHHDLIQQSKDTLKEIRVLYGVPATSYDVFVFTELFESKLDSIKNLIVTPDSLKSHDPIKISTGNYSLDWGNPFPPVHTMYLYDMFVTFDVTIKNAMYLGIRNDFTMSVQGIPSTIDFKGVHDHRKTVSIIPKLEFDRDIDVITSEFLANKFCEKEEVIFSLKFKEEVITSFNISKYIDRASINMYKNDVVIPIDINVSTVGITIKVNDWELPITNDDIIGS